MPPEIARAVAKTFAHAFGGPVDVHEVKVIARSRWADLLSCCTRAGTCGRFAVAATTRVNRIYLSSRTSPASFFADAELLLHEYYHVLRQWNTREMTSFTYLLKPSRWEAPAYRFGATYRSFYERLLRAETPLAASTRGLPCGTNQD